LHDIIDYGILYQGRLGADKVLDINGFVDVDSTGDLDRRRSKNGYVFNLFGGAINWIMSKRKYVVSFSIKEDEYMATNHASKEDVWLHRLCLGIGFVQQVVRLDCDNHSAIFHYQLVRGMVEDKNVLLVKVDTL
jgi:hypothetical protein